MKPEVTIVNNVIGAFRDLWRLTNLQASWILSIWFVGIMIGAYLFGEYGSALSAVDAS